MPRAVQLALFLAVGVVLLGCGGSETTGEEYEEAYSEISRSIDLPDTSLPDGLSQATNGEEAAEAVRPYGEIIGETASAYGSLEPPEGIAAEHQAWVDFLHQMSDAYIRAADQLPEADSAGEAQAILERVTSFIVLPENQEVMRRFATAVADGGLELENPFIEADAAEGAAGPDS